MLFLVRGTDIAEQFFPLDAVFGMLPVSVALPGAPSDAQSILNGLVFRCEECRREKAGRPAGRSVWLPLFLFTIS